MENEFGIHSLRSGMIVEVYNGYYYLVELGQSHHIMMKMDTLGTFSSEKSINYVNLSFSTYDKYLTTKNRDHSDYDVVRVYDFIKNIKNDAKLYDMVNYYCIFDRYNICIKCIHNKVCKYTDDSHKVGSCKEFICV